MSELDEDTRSAHASRPQRRVLVVDDEEAIRDYVATVLEDAGFSVELAENGWIALGCVEDKDQPAFDLVVTDIRMPRGLDGVQLVQKARAKNQDLRVLYISGYVPQLLGYD